METRTYSPLYVEALAYHEAGHALICLVFGIPIIRIVIAEACDDEGFNGQVVPGGEENISYIHCALMLLASAPAEKLSPNYRRFGSIKRFSVGRRNDRINAFHLMAPLYRMMRYAESTALRAFRENTREPLAIIMAHPKNIRVVKAIAKMLMIKKRLEGDEVEAFRRRVTLPKEAATLSKWLGASRR